MKPKTILCLNAGSSSLKYALFAFRDGGWARVAGGAIEEIGSGEIADHQQSLGRILDSLADFGEGEPDVVGHRIVHGGTEFTAPVLVDDAVLDRLRKTIPLAPSHQPAAIAGMETLRKLHPDLPQVACFDTDFHRPMPDLACRLPLPDEYGDKGIRRYGFHGLSFQSVVDQLGAELPAKTIIAHLGNGSSLVALSGGHPVETTMGFTPNSGLVMGSRSGDIEPGVLLYLMREQNLTADEIEHLLITRSGMRGISGSHSDVRKLLGEAEHNPAAARAIDHFCYSALKHIGSLVAVLGGLDLLIFTGGIGQNATPISERIVTSLRSYLNFDVRVVSTDEEQVMARLVGEVYRGDSG